MTYAGIVAVKLPTLPITTLVAKTPPILTVVPGRKALPKMVTVAPPETDPVFGVIDSIVGDNAW